MPDRPIWAAAGAGSYELTNCNGCNLDISCVVNVENVDMHDGLRFDPDLYRGTAGYYDRFRVPYPPDLLDDLRWQTRPTGQGRLLDLACGTGQVTFAIADHFAEVWAVDQEAEMIEMVRSKAYGMGAGHVRGIVASAESLAAPVETFELVAIGNAFHRLRRDLVANSAFRWLQPLGCIALLWASVPWQGEAEWQHAMASVIAKWQATLGTRTRVPTGWERTRQEQPDRLVLRQAGFEGIYSAQFLTPHEWTVDALIGFVYSTSALPRSAFGDQAITFEHDLRRELCTFATDDRVSHDIDFAYEIGRRPE